MGRLIELKSNSDFDFERHSSNPFRGRLLLKNMEKEQSDSLTFVCIIYLIFRVSFKCRV